MGIREFASQEEYAFFCVLLMFLEDREPDEQFILSQLTDYVAANLPGGAPDWTSYTPAQEVDPGPPVCPGTGAAGCD